MANMLWPLRMSCKCISQITNPDSKFDVAIMGPTWVLSAQVGPMLAPWTLLSVNELVW